MMKKIIALIKVIVFIVLFSMIFLYVNEVVGFKQLTLPWNMTNKITGLRNEPKNTMDVMYFGSSHMYCSINPVVMWEEAGIPSYSFATQQQPVWISYHYMKEALKYQKPKVMVLDVLMTKQQEDYSAEGINRTAIDLLPMSLNRIAMIQASVPKGERASYVINFIKYHSRWQELKEEDWAWANAKFFGEEEEMPPQSVGPSILSPFSTDPLKGYVMLDKISPITEKANLEEVTDQRQLTDKTTHYLQKIIDLTEEEGIQLVLYKAPSTATAEEKEYFNAVEEIAKVNAIPFIDYNMLYEEIGLDQEKDFYDKGHVNYVGAEKVTKHFTKFLQEHVELTDRRTEDKYANWKDSVAYYKSEKEARPLKMVEK